MSHDDGTLAGWHRDPSARHELRFWDGFRWTEHVVDAGIPGLDHATRSGRPAATASPTPVPPLPRTEPAVAAAQPAEPAASAAPPTPAPASTPAPEPEPDPGESSVLDLSAEQEREAASGVAQTEAASPSVGITASAPAASTEQRERDAEQRVGAVSAPGQATDSTTDDASGSTETTPDPATGTPATTDPSAPDAAPAVPTAAEPRTPAPKLPRLAQPRVVVEPPSVASPAGSSSGATTSAIADPHRTAASPGREGPRVAGLVASPARRYHPGSPPASPHIGARALSGAVTIAPPAEPWYRRASVWLGVLIVAILAGGVIAAIAWNSDDGPGTRLPARPPAAAPVGHKVIEGDGVGIAAPRTWTVGSEPGDSFRVLRRADWGEPLSATDPAGGNALLIVPLINSKYQPLVDPDRFWADQIRPEFGAPQLNANTLDLHGYRANRVTISGDGGLIEAAAIDTGDRTYLVAVSGTSATGPRNIFDRLIQTFDAR